MVSAHAGLTLSDLEVKVKEWEDRIKKRLLDSGNLTYQRYGDCSVEKLYSIWRTRRARNLP